MWACRSFLRRPNALIASRLQPAYRHDPTNAAVPCRNLIAASRRHVSDATNGDPHPAAAAAATTKQHLYLVLDDHKKDYGIYKLDVDADLVDGGDGGSDSLPRPAHIRMGVPEKYRSAQFASTGGCIVATGCLPYEGLIHGDDFAIVTILYDVKTATLSVSTHPTETLQDGYVVDVPVGNRMYVLDSHTDTVDSFNVMTTSKDDDDDDAATDGDDDVAADDDDVAADGEVKQRDWGWYPDSPSSRCGWTYGGKVRSWSDQLPFSPDNIQAYAVHPRGCTIYVSARVSCEWRCVVEAFAYDTTIMAAEWTSCVTWGLPFKGHARYDRQLNMWVGLDLHLDEGEGEGTTGYLCACGIPSSEYPDYPPEPKGVCSTEKILLDDPDRRRIDFKLVYMGERSEYCLFERLRLEGADEKKSVGDGEEECVLRLTMFRLKYECDKPDHIRIMDRRACSYKVSRHRDDFEAQAFCL